MNKELCEILKKSKKLERLQFDENFRKKYFDSVTKPSDESKDKE